MSDVNALAFCIGRFDKTDQTLNAHDYEIWLWKMIMKYDYEIWLWSKEWNMIMKYDYETWLWIMKHDWEIWLWNIEWRGD